MKSETCVSKEVTLESNKKKVPVVQKLTIFSMYPQKYTIVYVTGSKKWCTDYIVPEDFI